MSWALVLSATAPFLSELNGCYIIFSCSINLSYCFFHCREGLLQILSSRTNAHISSKYAFPQLPGFVALHPKVSYTVSFSCNGALKPTPCFLILCPLISLPNSYFSFPLSFCQLTCYSVLCNIKILFILLKSNIFTITPNSRN